MIAASSFVIKPAQAAQFNRGMSPNPIAFATEVMDYAPGSGVSKDYRLSHQALGAPDYRRRCRGCDYVSLGNGGSLTLQFTDHWLTGSDTPDPDLWIFEIGTAVEATQVELSDDGQTWVSVGTVVGATSTMDLDAWGLGRSARFDWVRLTDVWGSRGRSFPSAGADIDAVGAIAAVAKSPEVPEPHAIPEPRLWISLGAIAGIVCRWIQPR